MCWVQVVACPLLFYFSTILFYFSTFRLFFPCFFMYFWLKHRFSNSRDRGDHFQLYESSGNLFPTHFVTKTSKRPLMARLTLKHMAHFGHGQAHAGSYGSLWLNDAARLGALESRGQGKQQETPGSVRFQTVFAPG